MLKEKGVYLVLDIVGGEYFEKNFLLLKEEGRLIQVVRMWGGAAIFDLSRLMFKRLTVLGSTLRAQSSAAKAKIAQELLSRVWPLFEERTLKPVVTATFPLANAADAHKLMESSQHCGKIVLIVQS
ncbi:MAG: zinc-binding dehydrogenase [Verrucomicrobia bacterium]|nr:zinc-binding dehydrogenase [Verrucomicrobiota bacterium]